MPPGRRIMANWISFRSAPRLPLRKPIRRGLPVSEAVNSRYPSPAVICCFETAPASAHPSQPEIFVSELPADVTLTRLLQTTPWVWVGTAPLHTGTGPGIGTPAVPAEATPAPGSETAQRHGVRGDHARSEQSCAPITHGHTVLDRGVGRLVSRPHDRGARRGDRRRRDRGDHRRSSVRD